MVGSTTTTVVVGLGYVGLPLAIELAEHNECWGLDINRERVSQLRQGYDRTGEISSDRLAASAIRLTDSPADCPDADFFIVTVPTPIDADNRPDLGPLTSASKMIAGMLRPGRRSIVVYESTVYPGVTEEYCAPLLEQGSGLECGSDFFVAYSPERINPGDREHTVSRITKVVSGQTEEVLEKVAALYGAITTGGVFRAASIKTAEAAKVIENAQRDINIAFMNEITRIFEKMDVSIWDVLAAARTKWNFLPFEPGLVGGHCIGVDPYYLSHRAAELGLDPQVILAGRSTNDGMAAWIADRIHARRGGAAGTALILGLTFKPDVPDIRNSKVVDLIERLRTLGHEVTVHDPLAHQEETRAEYGIELDDDALSRTYDLVVLAVPHATYLAAGHASIEAVIAPGGLIADIKGAFRGVNGRAGATWWSM